MLKLKKGYTKKFDENKKVMHIYPKKGKSHYFDKCWCSPITNNITGIITHHYSKENPKNKDKKC